jgi:hypothetical protein
LSKPGYKTTNHEANAARRKQTTLFEHPFQAHHPMSLIMDAGEYGWQ